jgi:hypothetical protein
MPEVRSGGDSGFIQDVDRVLDIAVLGELEFNCQTFLDALNRFKTGLTHMPVPGSDVESFQRILRRHLYGLWADSYSMIHCAYRATELLREVERAGPRRKQYGLPDSRYLTRGYVAGLRHALEHTESRLSPFVKQSFEENPHRPISGWHTTNDPEGRPDPAVAYFRSLNLATKVCSVADSDGLHECSLLLLAQAMSELNLSLPGERSGQNTIVKLPPEPGPPSGSPDPMLQQLGWADSLRRWTRRLFGRHRRRTEVSIETVHPLA